MPTIDLPLNELKTYMGSSPIPLDFDQFWEESLNEMRNIDSNVTITESNFQVPNAKCYDLYFTGVGGARIYAKLVKPAKINGKLPAVIRFHGYSSNSGDWSDLFKYTLTGYIAVAMDCRGQGGKSEDIVGVKGGTMFGHIVKGIESGPKALTFRNIFLDTAQLANIVMSMDDVDESRVATMGCSQGGALTLVCAALEPRIKKLIPVYPFLSDYKRVWDMDLAIDAYIGIKDYLRRFDPTHSRINEFFNILGYIDIQNLVNRIKGEVKFVTGLADKICPPSTQFAAYNKIMSKKDIIIYPDFGHEHLPKLGDMEFDFLNDL